VPVVNLQAIDDLDIEFSFTQQDTANVKLGQEVVFTVDTYPGKTFHGFITATNVGFDKNSRMLLVRANLLNPSYELYPGMYGKVNV
jgi:membrane fusion protein (multidrug efflux system)